MSGSVHKVILVGRLGKDPEIKYTPSGAPVANFSLATDEVFKDRSGEQQRRTEWHRIVAWNRLAEICGQYLTKGKQVYIEGSIRSREWEDPSGNKRTAYEIVAREMKMLGSRADTERAAAAAGELDSAPDHQPAPRPDRSAPEPSAPRSQPNPESEITDEDLPF
jgi:single-strand DNA-binding protein